MADFRTELRERIAAVMGRTADEVTRFRARIDELETGHKKAMDAFGRERAALEQLLAIEDERAGVPGLTRAQKVTTLVPLADYLVTKVQAHGSMEKDELRATASLAGYLVGEGAGRKFHTTLLNITKAGRLKRLPSGRYASPEDQPTMTFDAENQEAEMQTIM